MLGMILIFGIHPGHYCRSSWISCLKSNLCCHFVRRKRRRVCLGCEWPAGGAFTKWSECLAWWLGLMSTCQRWVRANGKRMFSPEPSPDFLPFRPQKGQLLLIEADTNPPDDVMITHITKYIYSRTVLEYQFEVLVLNWSFFFLFMTLSGFILLYFRGKYCTFYCIIIIILQL